MHPFTTGVRDIVFPVPTHIFLTACVYAVQANKTCRSGFSYQTKPKPKKRWESRQQEKKKKKEEKHASSCVSVPAKMSRCDEVLPSTFSMFQH